MITAIYKNDVHVGFGKVTRDLTERKGAELQLIAAYEESAKMKSEFLANISHEVRTPMHGMLSASALLLDTPLNTEQRETVSIIEESGEVLLGVINDILDYSKLTSGSFSINSDVVNPSTIVASVVRSVQATLAPEVHIKSSQTPDVPLSAQGDPLRYRQILHNIVANAGKFTEKGSISVHTSLVSEDEITYMVQTEVSDTGIGVSEDATEHLFKPFTQLDSTIKKRYQGTGLGLSIAKSLTELLGGQIGYRPNSDCVGSVFWFTVKLQKSPRKIPGHAVVASQPTGIERNESIDAAGIDQMLIKLRETGATKRILAAEDNVINQLVLRKTLHTLGLDNITMVSDGAQAIVELLNSSNTYDLVLMDVNMPVMDGHKATIHIRNHGLRLPVIAMTAYALKGDMELCLEKGMDDYIVKPVNRNLLLETLFKWLM